MHGFGDHAGATVQRQRQRFVQEGFVVALSIYRSGERVYERKLDGAQEAHLVALGCGTPLEGQARWTLRLLASRVEPSGSPDMVEIRAELEAAGRFIRSNDLLIGAHAYTFGATVVAANVGEFQRVRGLNVENWLA